MKLSQREDKVGQSKRVQCRSQRTSLKCGVHMGREFRERITLILSYLHKSDLVKGYVQDVDGKRQLLDDLANKNLRTMDRGNSMRFCDV